MITKEDILESITGALLSDKPTHSINIPIGWIFQAMQQYAEEYHKTELLKLNKSDVTSSVCICECGKKASCPVCRDCFKKGLEREQTDL